MVIEFLCHGAGAMIQLIQTGLFLSEEDAVFPTSSYPMVGDNCISSTQLLLLETLSLAAQKFHSFFSYVSIVGCRGVDS